jgi:hypothetical protein
MKKIVLLNDWKYINTDHKREKPVQASDIKGYRMLEMLKKRNYGGGTNEV